MRLNVKKTVLFLILITTVFSSCRKETITTDFSSVKSKKYQEEQTQLKEFLLSKNMGIETRYGVINKIASNMLSVKDYNSLILFLSEWVEKNPDDIYNAYWLLMISYAYLENEAQPVAEYYLERILKNCADLRIDGKSIHFLCLQQLIQISTNSANRIYYFHELINRFSHQVNITELYIRLAIEYENEGNWKDAMDTYRLFLEQSDAASIQIAGIPDAYLKAKRMVDFDNSPKDWTFESCDALVTAIKRAINTYNTKALDNYKSKVNFFAMSWRQDETATNAEANFSMNAFMKGNRIHYSNELDKSSGPNEAYLRTTGWSHKYVNTWYLYFRKVNFPADPEIHGRWEWAGIYFGEKL